MKKLTAAADELSTRWKWAEAMADVDWSATARFGRIQPEPAEPTDAEKAEIEKLRTRHDELVNTDEDAWTDALVEEAEAIEPRLDEIEAQVESRARFKPEDFAMAGCILEKIERHYGRSDRVWIMDRGIPTEETLALMREGDAPVRYLVGTPKGRLTRLEASFLDLPWQEVRQSVEVKLLAEVRRPASAPARTGAFRSMLGGGLEPSPRLSYVIGIGRKKVRSWQRQRPCRRSSRSRFRRPSGRRIAGAPGRSSRSFPRARALCSSRSRSERRWPVSPRARRRTTTAIARTAPDASGRYVSLG